MLGTWVKMFRRTIGLGILSGTVATVYSVYDNDFNIDSVGIVRFGRAAITVRFIFHCYISFNMIWNKIKLYHQLIGYTCHVSLQNYSVCPISWKILTKLPGN